MRIYPILTIPVTNFKAKSIASRMDDMKDNYSWWKWNIGGGKSEARSRAEAQLNDECSNSEREANIAEEKAETFYKYSRNKLDSQEERIREKQNTLNELQMETYQNNRTIDRFKSELSSNSRTISRNYNQAENLKNENSELQNRLVNSRKEYADLKQETVSSKKNSENYIRAKVKETQKSLKTQQQVYIKETENRLQGTDILAEQIAKLSASSKKIGLAQVQGYDYAKEALYNFFIEPLQHGREASIPNGVLLFGPQGCGKTSLAQAFAESSNHKIAYFKPTMNNDRAYNQLVDLANYAKDNYQSRGTRTFILVDEFDSFAPKGSTRSEQMKNLTDYISKQYHCSILATTNFPEKIDPILLRDGRFEKIAIGPAYKDDLKKIIYRYLNGCFNNDTEISELIDIILNNKNGRYSNSLIRSIIDNKISHSVATKIELDASQLKKAFQETMPDISHEFMELFKKQLQYVQKI